MTNKDKEERLTKLQTQETKLLALLDTKREELIEQRGKFTGIKANSDKETFEYLQSLEMKISRLQKNFDECKNHVVELSEELDKLRTSPLRKVIDNLLPKRKPKKARTIASLTEVKTQSEEDIEISWSVINERIGAKPSLSTEQKYRLVSLLLDLPTLVNSSGIELLEQELPSVIKNAIPQSSSSSRTERITNIVNTCLNYNEGFRKLMQVIYFRESKSNTIQLQVLTNYLLQIFPD